MPSLITKQDARDLGLFRYFTGEPCGRGHISERLANGGACVQCMRDTKTARSKTREYKDRLNARLAAKRAAARAPKPCIVCRTLFDIMVGNRTSAKTCSPECSEVLYQQNAGGRRKKPDRECEQCFALFASRNPAQTTCSRRCRDALDAEQRAARERVCLHCRKVFTLGDRSAANGFCDDECRETHRAKVRAAYHQMIRVHKPETLHRWRMTYETVNVEAHKRTTKMVNDRRIAGETAAFEVAKEMIPDMLATAKGYRAKINMSVEFMRSLGINPSMKPGEPNVPLR